MAQKTTTPQKSKVAQFIEAQIAVSDLSQKEIAERIGYSKPNVITMLKQGTMKLPIDKVAPMANALGVDPVRLLRLTMEEYMPETWEAVQGIVGFAITDNEKEIVEFLRNETKDSDPKLRTTEQKKHLKRLADSLT